MSFHFKNHLGRVLSTLAVLCASGTLAAQLRNNQLPSGSFSVDTLFCIPVRTYTELFRRDQFR